MRRVPCGSSTTSQALFRSRRCRDTGDNIAAHRLFERVGFAHEGIRRRAYWRRGGWLDGVMFGLLAEELVVEAP